MQELVRDLNRLYRETPALHYHDFESKGFEWIDSHDAAQSVISYVRQDDEDHVVVVMNFTPVPRHNYRIGVPEATKYREIFNSDAVYYGGANIGNWNITTESIEWMGRAQSVSLTLPPLAGIVLAPVPSPARSGSEAAKEE
jgi:1,4-alpha-glucan branching enzyme